VEAVKAALMTERRRRELFGVIWTFLALFFSLCLLSFSPRDPCLFIREGAITPVKNWMGPLGADVSGWLYALIGFSAWLIPPLLAAFALWNFRGKGGPTWKGGRARFVVRVVGAVMLLFAVSVFLELALDTVKIDQETVRAGGIAGGALGRLLAGLLGSAGALIAGALLAVTALMAAADFSPVKAARMAADAAYWARDQAGEAYLRWRERRRRREEVTRDRDLLEKTRTQREIKIVTEPRKEEPPKKKAEPKPKQEKMPFLKEGHYELPGIELLDEVSQGHKKVDQETLLMNARILENKLRDFGVSGEVVEIQPGPVITMYEYKPGSGIKINKIAGLADDLAMALSAVSVRIIAPIPGKNVVGIEISNVNRETVSLREIVESQAYGSLKSPLPLAIGKSITGEPFAFDIRRAPHLLVAGSTGSGKSVSLNAMIMSVLHRSTPHEVQMLMIDPKRLELSTYEGIPHLIHRVIADPKDAAVALKWAVAEMERRYTVLAEYGVRNIDSFNRLVVKGDKDKKKTGKAKKAARADGEASEHDTYVLPDRMGPEPGTEVKEQAPPQETMPVILVIIDELADLMMVAARDCEESICRLAQMARAAGIHLILATQRPSVDVITGLIKANFPARIAFKVASKTDSRTILDQNGAERLLGQGDMLFIQPGTTDLVRLHGAFVSDQEIKRVTEFWREQGQPEYDEAIIKPRPEDQAMEEDELDEHWNDALRLVAQTRQVSVSMLQRRLKIGYNRAARIVELMEKKGLVGPSDGVKPREVLIDMYQLEQMTG